MEPVNGKIDFSYRFFGVEIAYFNSSSFLWTFRDGVFKAYGASGKNDYFMFTDPNFIALGCSDGKFGFFVDDSMLSGSSHPCATFENVQLSGNPEFKITCLEVWELADV